MEYLLPLDLCHCSIVNKFWYQMANDQSLWKQNCFLLWQDKQHYNEFFLLSSNEKELEKKYENFHKMINELNENNSAQDKKVQKKKKKR